MDRPLGGTVEPGDWIATQAGARYLVVTSRRMQRRDPAACPRYALTCERMPRGCDLPEDVVCRWLRWYPRKRR
jgi:hypothetical protein